MWDPHTQTAREMIVNLPPLLYVMISCGLFVLYRFAFWTNALFGQNKRMIIRERNAVVFQEDGEIVMYGLNKSVKKKKTSLFSIYFFILSGMFFCLEDTFIQTVGKHILELSVFSYRRVNFVQNNHID